MKHVLRPHVFACIAILATSAFAEAQPLEAPEPLHLKENGCVVTFLAFSNDGKTLAYGIWPRPNQPSAGFAVVWDRIARKDIQRIEAKVTNGAMSADGKTLVLQISGEGVSVWNIATGKKIADCEGSERGPGPSKFAFLPDGKTVVGSFWNFHKEGIHLWNAANGKLLRRLGDQRGYASEFAVSADGKYLHAAHESRRLVKFDPIIHKIRPRDGGDMVSESFTTECLWDLTAGKEVWAVESRWHRYGPLWGAFSSRTGGWDHGYRVRVSPGGQSFFTPPAKKPPLLLNYSRSAEISTVQDLGGKTIWKMPQLGKRVVEEVVFATDGRTLGVLAADVSTSEPGRAFVYDLSAWLDKERAAADLLAPKDLDALWSDLASDDDNKAHRAMFVFGLLSDERFLDFMKTKTPTIVPPDPRQIQGWIADLDSSKFAVRDRATKELHRLSAAEGADFLRAAQKGNVPVEQKRRLEQILAVVTAQPVGGETRRGLRVIELLEVRPLRQTRTFLELMARVAVGSWISLEAKSTIDRLNALGR